MSDWVYGDGNETKASSLSGCEVELLAILVSDQSRSSWLVVGIEHGYSEFPVRHRMDWTGNTSRLHLITVIPHTTYYILQCPQEQSNYLAIGSR